MSGADETAASSASVMSAYNPALFLGSGLVAAAAVGYFFLDTYVFRSPLHLGLLAASVLAMAGLLHEAYRAAADRTLARVTRKRSAAPPSPNPVAESTFFALFQVNFWFFVLFGLLAAVVFPLVEPVGFPGGKQSYGLVHLAVSGLLPALVVSSSGKSKYF